MRILHVTISLDPDLGGPPAVVARLSAAQAALGHRVHLLSYRSPAGAARMLDALSQVPGFDLVQCNFLEPPGRVERVFALKAKRYVSERLEDFDIIHVHGIWERISKVAADVARRSRKPYVVAPHGMLNPWSLQYKRLKKRIALALGYRRMLNGVTFLHTLNADEEEFVRSTGLDCPLEIIPNGIFLEAIEPLPPADQFRAAHPELLNDPYILFLSRLHVVKGLDFLADAFALVAKQNGSVRLVVVGPDGGARGDFEARIERAGLRDRVHLVGPLYGTHKFAAITGCACFCLPSRQEGFSIAITEALACRVPVVISDQCHFPQVAAAKAGYVVELNPQSIADGLLAVLANPERAKAMGEAGRNLVESQFTWHSIAKQCIAAYGRALGRSDRREAEQSSRV